MTGALIRRGTFGHRQKHRERTQPCEDRGRDWSYAAKSQGMPEAKKLGRAKEGFFRRAFLREHGAADTLIEDF